eukprot:3941352-Rhodomonas_salina.3
MIQELQGTIGTLECRLKEEEEEHEARESFREMELGDALERERGRVEREVEEMRVAGEREVEEEREKRQ